MRAYICDKCKKMLNVGDDMCFLVSSKCWDIDTRNEIYARSELCGECYRKVARFIMGEEE